MSFNFVIPEFHIGSGDGVPTIQMFRSGFRLGNSSQPSWQDIILSGNTALTLVNSKADGLNYVTLYGNAEQRSLPVGYTQVEYVTNDAETFINTGVKFDFSKNYEIELRVRGVTSSWYILQARSSAGNPISGFSGANAGATIIFSFNGTSVRAMQITRVNGHIYYIKGTINNDNLTLYVKDETAGTEETVTGTYTPTTGESPNVGLFGNTGGDRVNTGSHIYFARIKEDGNYILNYVPCTQDTTAGFYDKATNTFKTTTDLSAGADVTAPSPDTPMDIISNNGALKVNNQGQIYTDGTTETVTVTGKNLFNKDDSTSWGGWYPRNSVIDTSGSNRTAVIRCKPNTTYYFKHCTYAGGLRAFYTEEENWVRGSACSDASGNVAGEPNTVYSITTSANAKWLFILFGRREESITATLEEQASDYILSTEELTSSTPYEPYFNGGSATAEMLLKVGDYKDEQEVLAGNVSRNIGVLVLDGTEEWSQTTTGKFYNSVSGIRSDVSDTDTLKCSHFKQGAKNAPLEGEISFRLNFNGFILVWDATATVEQFKQWLADQYNAGTPVILVYPLATATTETVTAQPLSIQAGTNIITAEGSIDNLPLEVSYKAGVEVTITEVQNAQLDNNVEVTING